MPKWPVNLEVPSYLEGIFEDFTQHQINRLVQGAARYGEPNRRRRYASRMEKEVAAYMKTGNAEQLYNIANYAVLEMLCPQHPNHHYDATVESVTRKEK